MSLGAPSGLLANEFEGLIALDPESIQDRPNFGEITPAHRVLRVAAWAGSRRPSGLHRSTRRDGFPIGFRAARALAACDWGAAQQVVVASAHTFAGGARVLLLPLFVSLCRASPTQVLVSLKSQSSRFVQFMVDESDGLLAEVTNECLCSSDVALPWMGAMNFELHAPSLDHTTAICRPVEACHQTSG